MSDGLEASFSKIRPHSSSSLPHQKAPASLLHALEATFDDQKTERAPTAYFAALLTTLDGTLRSARSSGPSLRDGDVLPAELYLLAVVTPHVPPPVIRSNISTIISLTTPLFPALVPHAPPLRSQLSFYETIFRALDRSQFDVPGLRQSFESILLLVLDSRPKVRKRAAELVKELLSNPPPPSLRHPYAERVAAWLNNSLDEITTGVPKFKGKTSDTEGLDSAIHLLAFLRPILSQLPPFALPHVTSSLLSLPRLGSPYLSQSAYSILSELVTIPVEDPTNNVRDRLPEILDAVLSSRPPTADTILGPAWVSLLGHAMLAYHEVDSEKTSAKVGETWQALWNFLESTDATIRKATSQSLDLVGQCFTQSLIQAAVKENAKGEQKSVIGKIVSQASNALESLVLARSIPDVLSVISSLLTNLRLRDGPRGSPTAAEKLLIPIVAKIAEFRVERTFEFKEAADATLSRAMSVLGPEILLQTLPLNLEEADRQAGREPRAFLLPILKQPHPSPLSHFVSYFVPLTERMFDLQQKADVDGRHSEAKVWSVLVDQVWAGLYGYCYGTTDLEETLTAEFSQLLSQLLYNQPDLRPAVLRALRAMVESNDVLASGDEARIAKLPEAARADSISQEAAQRNVAFLRTQVESWLAVLFNVFSSAGRNGQGMVGEVIAAWVSIAGEKEIGKAYQKLILLLQDSVSKAKSSPNGPKESESLTAMTLDLLVLLLPHLSDKDASALFDACLSSTILESGDNGVQKRGYKILTKLVTGGKVNVDAADVLQRLEKLVDGIAPAAKKDRMLLLSSLVTRISSTSLHLLPSIIPEAVLGTKEPSEKARNAAFDLIVAMGHKMSAGGTVRRDLVSEMDQDMGGETAATIDEYMTMVAGGLAGASPHMISATVTAISRLVFEFKDIIPSSMHDEILVTSLVFLSSANREIVKSALGYVKLAIHTMSVDLLRPHLKQLVPALLAWSHDHKNHFKSKVRHIFERMLRRFAWEDIYNHAEQEEARKVLLNIRKRKERAKRKKNRGAENENGQDRPTKPSAGGDAFEDVLYGSESELDDSDSEGRAEPSGKRHGGNASGARLRVDNDEPMDLLSGAATRITTNISKKRRKPGQDTSRFKTDEDTGKMVIGDSDSDNGGAGGEDAAGTAYREALTSTDGFTRGPTGKIKFHKDTKKRRHEHAEEDVEMGDAETTGKASKKKATNPLGHEYKAKKAGGDIKKGGVDPYAYVPLSQAAKKKGRRERLNIIGKR